MSNNDSNGSQDERTKAATSVPPLTRDHADEDDEEPFDPETLLGEAAGSNTDPTLYKYRDFGHVAKDDDELGAEVPAPTQNGRGNSESSIRVQKFPVKLYAILAQKEFQDIICWMPHGRSWKVLKPSLFESLVMPLFFEYSNYHSFNRLVNAWSFRRISAGPDRGSYYHELFLRGKPHLQKYMRRLPKTHKKLPMKKKDEPDFYKLDASNPLPQIHEAPVPGAAATQQAMRANGQIMPVMSSPMSHHQTSSSIVTPHLSPHHGGPNIMGGHSGDMIDGLGRMDAMGLGMGGGEYNRGRPSLPSRYGGYGDAFGRPEDDYDSLAGIRPGSLGTDNGYFGGRHFGGYGQNAVSLGPRGPPPEMRRLRGGPSLSDPYERSGPHSDYYGGYPAAAQTQHHMMPPLYGRGGEGANPDEFRASSPGNSPMSRR